jgi:hypothetical protein
LVLILLFSIASDFSFVFCFFQLPPTLVGGVSYG